MEHSGCSGPTDSPLSTPYPSPGRPTTVTGSAHPPRPTPSGRILRAPQEFHQGPGRPGVTRQGLGGHPGHLEVAASARGLLTSCGVDASSDTGAGHQAGPTATRGPSPAATEEKQVLHGRDGGAGVLPGDQVPVQHHVQGVRLAGCKEPKRRGLRLRAGRPETPPPCPAAPAGARDQGSHGPLDAQPGRSPLKQAPASFTKSSTTRGRWAKPGARTSSYTEGCGARAVPRVRGLWPPPGAARGEGSTAGAKLPGSSPASGHGATRKVQAGEFRAEGRARSLTRGCGGAPGGAPPDPPQDLRAATHSMGLEGPRRQAPCATLGQQLLPPQGPRLSVHSPR